MARKIFVSYKHEDADVYPIEGGLHGTARDYVDFIETLFDGEEIYKGERGNEDLSMFTDETIRSQIRDQIFDSTVTIVLISRNMKEGFKDEREQFIPWEVAFSVKETQRGDRTSKPNALLAVVLPDNARRFTHFIQEIGCPSCPTTMLLTDNTFRIIDKNMFNHKNKERTDCPYCVSFRGAHSYMPYVRWDKFILDPDCYISMAQERNDNIQEYSVCKDIECSY